jgi:surface polysaccharide O-acyltransferase-like enzyme
LELHPAASEAIKQRNYAVDILKTIAIIGVLTIHISASGYESSIGSFDWYAAVFWGCISRASVPIFFMCSGALLLDPEKQISLRKLYAKNLLRITVALFFWALMYKIYGLFVAENLNNMQEWIKSIKEVILFRHESHLYYLHIMILVYVFLPVTRIMTTYASKRQMEYFLLIWSFLGIVYPTLRYYWPLKLLSGIPSQWSMNMTYASIGYCVVGFYLQKYRTDKIRNYIAIWLAGFTIVFGGTLAMSLSHKELYQKTLEGMSPGVAAMAVGMFGTVVSAVKENIKVGRIIVNISKASFCIYLVHMLFIKIYKNSGYTVFFLPTAVSIPILVIANFICSYVLYLLLSRIPITKKYLV